MSNRRGIPTGKRSEATLSSVKLSPDFGATGFGDKERSVKPFQGGAAKKMVRSGATDNARRGSQIHEFDQRDIRENNPNLMGDVPIVRQRAQQKGSVSMSTWQGANFKTVPVPEPPMPEVPKAAPREDAAARQARLLAVVASAAEAASGESLRGSHVVAARVEREQAVSDAVGEATKKAWQESQRDSRGAASRANTANDDALSDVLAKASKDKDKDKHLRAVMDKHQADEEEHKRAREKLERERLQALNDADKMKVEKAALEESLAEYQRNLKLMQESSKMNEDESRKAQSALVEEERRKVEEAKVKVRDLELSMAQQLAESQTRERELIQEKAEVEKKLDEAKQNIGGLEGELESNRVTHEQMEAEVKEVTDAIEKREQEVEKSRELIQTLENQLKEVDEVNWNLERQLTGVSGEKAELEDLLYTAQNSLTSVTAKCDVTMKELSELQGKEQRRSHEESQEMQKALEDERAVRESMMKRTMSSNKALEAALEDARRQLAKAKEDNKTQSNNHQNELVNQENVMKSMKAVKAELEGARNQLNRLQTHAKQVVEKERDNVQRLQRELASTKEMLRVSQKNGGKGSSKYGGMGGQDVIKAAREQIFGKGPPEKSDEEEEELDDDVWGDFDANDITSGMVSPIQSDWDNRADMQREVYAELEGDSGGSFLPPVQSRGSPKKGMADEEEKAAEKARRKEEKRQQRKMEKKMRSTSSMN